MKEAGRNPGRFSPEPFNLIEILRPTFKLLEKIELNLSKIKFFKLTFFIEIINLTFKLH